LVAALRLPGALGKQRCSRDPAWSEPNSRYCGPHPYPTAEVDPAAAELRRAVTDADTPLVGWQGALDAGASPLDARWRQFRDALKADAGAKLLKG
jgi:hypothetical protein